MGELFEPVDFENFYSSKSDGVKWEEIAAFANEKVRKGSKVFYGAPGKLWEEKKQSFHTHQGLMINMKGLVECAHPPEKLFVHSAAELSCRCGEILPFEVKK